MDALAWPEARKFLYSPAQVWAGDGDERGDAAAVAAPGIFAEIGIMAVAEDTGYALNILADFVAQQFGDAVVAETLARLGPQPIVHFSDHHTTAHRHLSTSCYRERAVPQEIGGNRAFPPLIGAFSAQTPVSRRVPAFSDRETVP